MKLAYEILINAIKDQAYAALNDPKVQKKMCFRMLRVDPAFKYRIWNESGAQD